MIVITTQIQHLPGKGVSTVGLMESFEATEMEKQIAQTLDGVITAAFEELMKLASAGNAISGDDAVIDLVRARIENSGLKFDGTPVGKILKQRKKRE
jgi:Ran GTPase-activating protein (RanGAP) involved in mRNA processing and transport